LSGPALREADDVVMASVRSLDSHHERRRTVTPRIRLRIMKRDRYRCTNCGAMPSLDPGVVLEIDHVVPFSRGGSDDDDNLATLCLRCARGKGSDEALNKGLDADLLALLYRINPKILDTLEAEGEATVIANAEDFTQLSRLSRAIEGYEVVASGAVIIGRGARAGPPSAIYTVDDNHGTKALFSIAIRR
jgi:hypothetical protein